MAGASVALALSVLAGVPASATPSAHDTPSPSPSPSPTADHSGHSGHGAPAEEPPPDHDAHGSTSAGTGPSEDTRLAVLGGFGAVNAAALGTALVLRRRDRRSGRATRGRR
jgi:hypothetical protein